MQVILLAVGNTYRFAEYVQLQAVLTADNFVNAPIKMKARVTLLGTIENLRPAFRWRGILERDVYLFCLSY